MQCKVLTILLVVHQSGWGEVVSSGYRASRRGWGTEGVSHRLRQFRSAASSLSTFVMPSKCVRACNVPTDRGMEGGASWLCGCRNPACACPCSSLAHLPRHAATFEVNLKWASERAVMRCACCSRGIPPPLLSLLSSSVISLCTLWELSLLLLWMQVACFMI